ncbi:ABC transporter permease [Sporolactobacillus nakayamae]|uniref:Putative spermidine/putrescine transport system permease protein n=1 Tax=Sporolactobacillus nakayamae TaxID=269670 RepID=A0A1I2UCH3_9BACL|nr:ABC transporter permease subunit [Sporolactobacillus nakayamae]SFG74895.1 putative spermidine/putrescine transport system permease protein [Sporolactobacillus nakayamae]
MSEGRKWPFYLIVILLALYLIIPLFVTLIYSLATSWSTTILPSGLTLKWYASMFEDPTFINALIRTLLLILVSMAVVLIVMIPTVVIVSMHFPRLEKLFQSIVLLPYAMPGIILASGLLQTYSSLEIPKLILVGGAYFIVVMPYMYQGIRNSLQSVNMIPMIEAAELLGSNQLKIFFSIIIPNIKKGILVSSLLSFSILFGEFTLTNLVVGGNYETIQIYLFRVMQVSGHISSAVVIAYLFVLSLLSLLIILFTNGKKKKQV